MINVIDNFLPLEIFNPIQSTMMGNNFPWFYNSEPVYKHEKGYDPKAFQFFHSIFDEKKGKSRFFSLYEKVFPFLSVEKLVRLKGNLNARTFFPRRGGYHFDYADITTAILYINTCNGGTKFKGGKKIKSVANRVTIFDSNLIHSNVSCTDEKVRVVLNFNYIQQRPIPNLS